MVYVGIDFSLNSPAFCIFQNNKFFWGSLTRSDRTEFSLKKSKDKPFSVLSEYEDFGLYFMEKKPLPEEYSEKERIKIDYFQELIDSFWTEIKKRISVHEDIYFAMEGLSFASNGNSLIDISMATALIRKKIVDEVGSKNFFVFSPTAVKKFAKKGNAKKDELYHSIREKEINETNFLILSKTLDSHKDQWITKSGAVNKPIDDIVDATWVCLYLIEEINGK